MNDRSLRIAGLVFAVGTAVHIADHLRRGQTSISAELNALGTVGLILQVVILTLIFTSHPVAPRASLLGFALAIGFGAAHWLPHWSVLSDPIMDLNHLRWLTAFASAGEIIGALMVAVAGLRLLRSIPAARHAG